MASFSYLKAARASDFSDTRERRLYRALEMFPGLLSWGTLALAVLGSWLVPVWTAFFVIALVLFWLGRTSYLSLHLHAGYKKMREHEKRNWREALQGLPGWEKLYHAVVIPTYREPKELLRGTLEAIVAADYPREKMIVVLGIEARAGEEARRMGEELKAEYGSRFFRFLVSVHPDNIAGEIPGKGSNETYAAQELQRKVTDPLSLPYENVILSSFDADTVAFPQYFSCLSYHYLTARNPTRTSFQPIPLYVNNIWEASLVSRLFAFSSTFWHTMNQFRPEKLITFSSHAMSFQALVDVGFKDTHVVSDDSRIFWQCFLFYHGDYRVQPLYYPISMDVNTAPGFLETLKNIYRQQRRWAYGVENVPYMLYAFAKDTKIPFSKKCAFSLELVEGHWSWATAPLLILMLGWLPLILGGQDFSQSVLSYNLPRFLSWTLTLSMIGLIGSVYFSLSILPSRPEGQSRWKVVAFALQWALMPLGMILLALPALDAQTRLMTKRYLGFWVTPKFRDAH